MNPVEAGRQEFARAAQAPLMELRSVSVRYGRVPGYIERKLVGLGVRRAPMVVRAVDDVSLILRQGEVLGLVGESGCGKSTLGRVAAGILRPTTGAMYWRGQQASLLPPRERRDMKLRVQMIFQNPYASLSPRMSAEQIVGDAPLIHGLAARGDLDAYVEEQLQRAGLDPSLKRRYPHQLSGGQRQRLGIARALAVRPELLVCDEAVAALDVSIQAQILNLFMDLREQLQLTYLFISHDLGVVEHISDRVAIMYLGRIVEEADTEQIFGRPNHPYTQALLKEIPRIDTQRRDFSTIEGELPSPLHPPPGCPFHPRCPHALPRCRQESPALQQVAPGHRSACHLNDMR